MKKIKIVFVLLSLLAMLTSVAAAPMTATAIALVEVRNDLRGSVVFVFSVDGRFTKSELKGVVQVQGEDANYDLYCSQVDDVTVRCVTSKKTGGKNVVVFFGGSVFWTRVPNAYQPPPIT